MHTFRASSCARSQSETEKHPELSLTTRSPCELNANTWTEDASASALEGGLRERDPEGEREIRAALKVALSGMLAERRARMEAWRREGRMERDWVG